MWLHSCRFGYFFVCMVGELYQPEDQTKAVGGTRPWNHLQTEAGEGYRDKDGILGSLCADLGCLFI